MAKDLLSLNLVKHKIFLGKAGLIHISNLTHEGVNKVEDVLTVGDLIEVKLMEIDSQGKINLSRKALLPITGKEAESNLETV